jgi:hypothetical protein
LNEGETTEHRRIDAAVWGGWEEGMHDEEEI